MSLKQINNIDEAITLSADNRAVLVEVFSQTCAPCKMVKQQLTAMVEQGEIPEGAEIVVLDFADDADYLSSEYGIRSVPTFLLFKNCQHEIEMGGAGAGQLTKYIDQLRSLAA